MKINWYPGHMAKSKRLMLEDLKQIDLICELRDARIPASSRNPDLLRMAGEKKRILILNRADQADPEETARWKRYFESENIPTLVTDSKSGSGISTLVPMIQKVMAEKIARDEAKGLKGRKIKIMACGIPNVGKSSFINRILGRKSAVAADKPGVTRSNQWFTLKEGLELMDTPGMLWPKIDDEHTGMMLAYTGTINDEILDLEELACELIKKLAQVAPGALEARYKLEAVDCDQPYETLQAMAKSRGFLLSRGEYNTERMARVLLDEFRSGKLGRITLELAPQPKSPSGKDEKHDEADV